MKRGIAVGLLIAAVLVMSAGAALAGVSDGNYRPERQHCSGGAEDVENSDSVEPDCQNFTTSVRDGNDSEIVRAGLPQLRDGENPDPTSAGYWVTPDGFDPSTGVRYYTGADDNLNRGEHDGSSTVSDGPSDGGSIVVNVEPASVETWVAAVMGADTHYLATHPLPLVDAGIGACTDGVCWSTQTQQRQAYDGGSTTAPDRDAANYGGYTWDPESCSSAEPTTADCSDASGTHDLSYWHNQSGDVYVQPGVQVYEDPSPNGSPLPPFYPIPGAYVGTCGVVVGGGPLQMPASPVTNSAGQIVIPTTC